jgi:hypothetical protein
MIVEVDWKAVSILGLAVVLRLPGLFTDFWLDEIWALQNVAGIESASGVFTGIHHDSNHWLVSLWMYAVGADRAFWLYRLPSFLAGVAAVVVSGALGRMAGGNGSLAMLFAAVCFPLGFYSTEARGYSFAVLAGLLSVIGLVRAMETRDFRWLAAYGVVTAGGILSHLSFLIVLVATLFFSLVMVGRGATSLSRVLGAHTPALAVLGLLVALDLRYLTIGGGPRTPPAELLGQTMSLAIGGPLDVPQAWAFAVLAAILVGLELSRMLRRFWRDRETTDPRRLLWLFYAAVLGLPLWLTVVLDPPFLFPRYFLVSIGFVPVLLASLTVSVSRLGALALLSLYLATNAVSWARFASEGRGHYEHALRDILASSSDELILVGSDQDFRSEMVVRFYRERIGKDAERIRYVRKDEAEAQFYLVERAELACRECVWIRSYSSTPLSGTNWQLFRRTKAVPSRRPSGPAVSLRLANVGLPVPVGRFVRHGARRSGDVSVLSAFDDLDVTRFDELLELLVLGGFVANLSRLQRSQMERLALGQGDANGRLLLVDHRFH